MTILSLRRSRRPSPGSLARGSHRSAENAPVPAAPMILALLLCLCSRGPAQDKDVAKILESVEATRIEATIRKLASFGTRHTFSNGDAGRGIRAAERWLLEEFQAIAALSEGRATVRREAYPVEKGPRVPKAGEVVNVLMELRGEDQQRVLIVSGHYDSRASEANDTETDAPGANDDASGVAVMLEAARALARIKPRCTILFVAYSGEEQGLLGSRAHAEALRASGVQVAAMITNDIVGGVRGSSGQKEPMRVRLFSEGVPSGPKDQNGRVLKGLVGSENDAPSRQLARYLAKRAGLSSPEFEVTLIFRQDRYLRGGDHKPFNDEGFPAVRFTECHENYDYQHQDPRAEGSRNYGDHPDHVDFEYVARVARVNIASLYELALAPAQPAQVRIMVDQLTPHSELRWAPSKEADLKGYAVLLRRTHEPNWTERVVVEDPKAESVLLEGRSKDDWLFAVEAFDEAGRRSLAVYPQPSYGRRR